MKRLTDLRFLFTAVAILEAFYAVLAIGIPPSMVTLVTGWVLSPDGIWITKLLGVALGSQALVAWIFRNEPNLGLAKALAAYQIFSATADWVMWILLANDGIFSTQTGQIGVMLAIPSHYLLGILLLVAIRRKSQAKLSLA